MPHHHQLHATDFPAYDRLTRRRQQLLAAHAPAQVLQAFEDLHYTLQTLRDTRQLPEGGLRHFVAKVNAHLDRLIDHGLPGWEEAPYCALSDLRDLHMEGQTRKLRLHLAEFAEPAVTLDTTGEEQLVTRMRFRALEGTDCIETLPTLNTPLIRQLSSLTQGHHIFEILATVILIPAGPGARFSLLVHDLLPSETPLQMVQATPAEIAVAHETLARLAQTRTPLLTYLAMALVEGLKIHGLEKASALRDSLEAMLVQAFSEGWINHAAGKIHTLIIGAPAVGKKLLTAVARVLNPVFYEAHPGKVTVAGVCSTAAHVQGTWRSKPGYLPLAHGGVFAIQDFHAIKASSRTQLLGIFNMVMEDGRVIDATAAQQTHPALTSIHLDTNKRTDLFPESHLRGETLMARHLDDLQIPMTSLSRFDFIIEIPRDAQRQIDIALGLYDQPVHSTHSARPSQSPPRWARDLQVLVALLRTRHASVTFPEGIRQGMQQKHAELCDANTGQLAQLPWLSDFQTRLTHSAFKYAAAYARMHNRQVPCTEDIDRTFHLLGRKVAFLATLSQMLQTPTTWQVPYRDDLRNWLQHRFAGREVQTGEMLDTHAEEFGRPLVRRTLERHLPYVAQRVQHGHWRFAEKAGAEDEGNPAELSQTGDTEARASLDPSLPA